MSEIDRARVQWDAPQIDAAQVQWDEAKPPMRRVGDAALSGFMRGGPVGMALGAGRTGAAIGQENLDRSAYRAGGAVTDFASSMGAPAPLAAGAGYATNVGIQALPVIAGAGVGHAFAQPLKPVANWLMQSAMKPNQAMRESGAAERAATTMLDRGISATRGGREQLQGLVTGLETQIDDILTRSPAQVDKYAVASTLSAALNKVKTNLSANADAATIQASFDDFINHPLLKNTQLFPVSLANKMKQSIYAALGPNAYVPGVKTGAARLADKTLARGLKEGVSRVEPAVAGPLSEQAELLNALKVMTPQAMREGNKNVLGIGAISPNLENLAAWLIDRNAYTKSLIARGLYSGAGPISTAAGGGAGGLLGNYSGQQPR